MSEMLRVPVKFGNVNAGADTVRLGIAVDRTKMGVAQAETFFCGSRLSVQLMIDPNASDDGQGQATFADEVSDESGVLSSVVDVKKFGASRSSFTAGLTFAIDAVDVGDVARFAAQPGTMVAERISDAGAEKEE